MTEKKTIQINPDFFKVNSRGGRGKTKKVGGDGGNDKPKRNATLKNNGYSQFIKPNKVKKELLKRVKEHQLKMRSQSNEDTTTTNRENNSSKPKSEESIQEFTNHFKESMEYLEKLIEQNKQKKQKQKTLRNKEKTLIPNETIQSNHSNTSQNNTSHLSSFYSQPISMKQQTIERNIQNGGNEIQPQPSSMKPQNIQTNVVNTIQKEPPYGCLKGGNKPTFKEYNKTLKKTTLPHLDNPIVIPETYKKNSINQSSSQSSVIHEKQREISKPNLQPQLLKPTFSPQQPINTQPIQQKISTPPQPVSYSLPKPTITSSKKTPLQLKPHNQPYSRKNKKVDIHSASNVVKEIDTIQQRREKLNKLKHSISNSNNKTRHKYKNPVSRFKKYRIRTIHKTYKLGKNPRERKVGVLIKNNETRKKVQNAIHELNKTHISKIKQYLRDKNLIKAGSSAPEYVLREMYKNAMLSGDISNKNKDALIHNFMNDDDN